MSKKMLIDAAHPEEVRVAVLDNGKVEDFDFESEARKPLRGNIYLARVTRVEPSLQAAFVEYGGNRHGFLAFSEIHPDYYQVPVSDRVALQEAEAAVVDLAAQLEETQRGDEDHDAADDEPMSATDRLAETTDSDDDGSIVSADDGNEPSHEDNKREPDDSVTDPVEEITETSPDEEEEDEQEEDGEEDEDGDTSAKLKSTDADDTDPPENDTDDDDQAPEVAAAESDSDTEDGSDEETTEQSEELDASAEDDSPAEPTKKSEADKARNERNALLDRYKDAKRKRANLLRNYKIQEVIKRRQILLIQVVKEERGNKGAALTTYISLAGRYCVLMPNTARGGGISRKIPHSTDRRRLRRVVDGMEVPQGMGLIIRTAGAKRTKTEIKRDYDYLLRLWENIRSLTLKSIAPCLVYEEASLIKRAIRDLYDKDIGEVQVEGEAGYREAKDFMKMLMPSHAKHVQPYKDKAPVFLKHGVEAQLDGMYQPTVRLKSGGYIVIHQTEALIAIDVNSGRATRERNIEQTALKTNIESAYEAARQFRLRDLAGLIVIDFIDMEEQKNNRKVEKALKDAIKNDRARIQVGRISNFGLMEMSRQRRRSGIIDGTTQGCPTCSGAGVIRSAEMAALRILRSIEGEAVSGKVGLIAVHASIDVSVYILNHHRDWIKRIEDEQGVSIQIIPDADKTGDDYSLDKSGTPRERLETNTVIQADQTDVIDVPEPEEVASSEEEDNTERDGERKKRRRRRRKKDASPRDESSEEASSETADSDGDDTKKARSDSDDEEQPKKRRRRGRRGGRRNRRSKEENTENGAESANANSDDPNSGDNAGNDGEKAASDGDVKPAEQIATNGADSSGSNGHAPEPESQPMVEAAPVAEAKPTPPAETSSDEQPTVPPKPKKKGWWRRSSDA